MTESRTPSLAETVISTTKSQNAEILVLDSMQSMTASDIEKGVSYLSVMGKNLEILASVFE